MAMLLVRLAFLVLLALPVAVPAQMESTDLTGVTPVSMKGIMAKDEATAQDVGWGGISFGFTGDNAGKIRWLGVVHASLFGGNTFGAKSAIFRAHEVPALSVAGPPNLATELFNMPDGARVQVDGAIDRKSHVILLDVVKQLPPSQ